MLYIKKWKKYEFTFDIITTYRSVGLGIDIGNDITYYEKPNNIYLEFYILFWTFCFELYWPTTSL